jgi:small subunit ribosomal protein S20
MPNIKSTEKRLRQSVVRNERNRAEKSKITRTRALLLAAIERKDKNESSEIFKQFCSLTDKAIKRGVVKRNTADRRKSRLAARIAALD